MYVSPSPDELGVPTRDGDIVEEHVAFGRPADQGPGSDRLEALPRPAATRAHDERRAGGASGALSSSSGPRLNVVSPTLSRISNAPQREQYAAASGL